MRIRQLRARDVPHPLENGISDDDHAEDLDGEDVRRLEGIDFPECPDL